MKGLAGAVAEMNVTINVADAYQDSRFDVTMDRRTGYRTRQTVSVPVRHPASGDCIGVLQVLHFYFSLALDSITLSK